MIDHITVSIDEATGTTRFLVGDMGKALLTPDCTVRRASHIEPMNFPLRLVFHLLRTIYGEEGKIAEWTRSWDCFWRVNLSPVGGPISTCAIKPRCYAIDAEIAWLEKNFI